MSTRIIYGNVNKNGSQHSWSGDYQVRKTDKGIYNINFEQSFSETPGFSVTQNFPKWNDWQSKGGGTTDNCIIIALDKTGARIKTGGGGGNVDDRNFSFIAVGK